MTLDRSGENRDDEYRNDQPETERNVATGVRWMRLEAMTVAAFPPYTRSNITHRLSQPRADHHDAYKHHEEASHQQRRLKRWQPEFQNANEDHCRGP